MSAELAVVYAALILEDDNVEITVSINHRNGCAEVGQQKLTMLVG